MRELSLNILDITQNSIKANATLVTISVTADEAADMVEIAVKDNGKGMSKDFLKTVTDPFTTTRTTRKVGMGLPLFKMAAESTGGSFEIVSELGVGTEVKAKFVISSIDRMPLGDLAGTMGVLMQGNGDIDFDLEYAVTSADGEKREFSFDTREVKEQLGDVPIGEYEVVSALEGLIRDNISETNGGITI